MKVIAITQARFGSTRLPGKVLKKIGTKTLLQIHLERITKAKKIDKLILATTHEKESDEICAIAQKMGLTSYQGSTNDVLDRYYQAAKSENPDYVVRITSDCPLVDPQIIDQVISLAIANNAEYCSNVYPPTFPDGMDVEIFKFSALKDAWENATKPDEREHVTLPIHNKSEKEHTCFNFSFSDNYNQYRLTVDEQEDFDLISKLILAIGDDKTWLEYVEYIKLNPHLSKINSKYKRNEGYIKTSE
jgi:spore coat polysaccharide biosynthesis protein SpsF